MAPMDHARGLGFSGHEWTCWEVGLPERQLGQVVKEFCGGCGGDRNCRVLGFHRERGDEIAFEWITDWQILRCEGCEHVFAFKSSTNSEDYDVDYDHQGYPIQEYRETKTFWPALSERNTPEWLYGQTIDADNGDSLGAALSELYTALKNDLNVLAGIGIRTSFDIASEILGIDASLSFQRKLDQLVADGHVSSRDLPRISMLVEAGSASAHRGWKPSKQDLDVMMEVLEHFIHDSLVAPHRRAKLDEKALTVSQTVPKRTRPAKLVASYATEQAPVTPHTAEPDAPRNDPA